MESVLGIVQSPLFVSIVLLLGLLSLVRVLLVRDSDLKRAKSDDRRSAKAALPALPFHDSDGNLVTAERRVQVDRRRSRLLAMQDEMERDGVAG